MVVHSSDSLDSLSSWSEPIDGLTQYRSIAGTSDDNDYEKIEPAANLVDVQTAETGSKESGSKETGTKTNSAETVEDNKHGEEKEGDKEEKPLQRTFVWGWTLRRWLIFQALLLFIVSSFTLMLPFALDNLHMYIVVSPISGFMFLTCFFLFFTAISQNLLSIRRSYIFTLIMLSMSVVFYIASIVIASIEPFEYKFGVIYTICVYSALGVLALGFIAYITKLAL